MYVVYPNVASMWCMGCWVREELEITTKIHCFLCSSCIRDHLSRFKKIQTQVDLGTGGPHIYGVTKSIWHRLKRFKVLWEYMIDKLTASVQGSAPLFSCRTNNNHKSCNVYLIWTMCWFPSQLIEMWCTLKPFGFLLQDQFWVGYRHERSLIQDQIHSLKC